MCEFWSAVVTDDGRVLWLDSVWSHEEIIKRHKLDDSVVELKKRHFVRIEINTEKNIYSFIPKVKDFRFKVDEEGTLPKWFTDNRKELESKAFSEFGKAFKTDKLFNRNDIRDFVKSLKKIRWFRPDGKPDKEWKMFYGDSWDAASVAAWNAASDAASDAAWNAASDAASDAARDAASDAAWNAARVAARNAARDAASVAAWNASSDAAWNAAWNAALMAGILLVSDLKYKNKKKHEAHALAMMRVWRKGYGLYCDVNGKLYVYAKRDKKKVKA